MRDIENLPVASGKNEYMLYLKGERLTIRQMVLAKCYDCMGHYQDGRIDCELPNCSLYPLMPYRKGEKYKSMNLTDDQKEKRENRLRANLEVKKTVSPVE